MKNSEHLDIYLASLRQPRESIGNISYCVLWHGHRRVIYIDGSNEPKDWLFNFLSFGGVLFHLGYLIMAIKFIRHFHFDKRTQYILMGTSFGGAVASIITLLKWRYVTDCITLGAPASYTIFNPIYPFKKITAYMIKKDIVRWAWLAMPFCRRAVKPVLLPNVGMNPIDSHAYGYQEALKKYFAVVK